MDEHVNWALDCHDTSMGVWNLLENLLIRCVDNEDCPADIPEKITEIMNEISGFAWCKEICEECDKILP